MLSITIITKNEERNIRRCLDSIQWAEEVVIVDSGSTDQTLAICKSYNCRIIHAEWLGFGKTKQLAVNETTHDWVLSIDADEVITPELQSAIQSVLKNPKADGYQIKRESFYLKRKIKYSGWQNDYPLRLFNKRKGQFNDAPVHESVIIDKTHLDTIEAPLLHYPYPSVASHINKINLYTSLGAEKLYKQGKQSSLLYALVSGWVKFIKMYLLKSGFLDGKEGFILALLSGFSSTLKYAKLWSLQRTK